MTRNTLPRTLVIALLVLGLAACGRKGMPDRPDDAVFPRDYPYTPLPAENRAKKESSTPDLNFRSGY